MSESENNTAENAGKAKALKRAIRIEDGLILLSIAVLFFLGVFHRRETWAQLALVPVLITMLAVFIRRLRRVKQAFEEIKDE